MWDHRKPFFVIGIEGFVFSKGYNITGFLGSLVENMVLTVCSAFSF